VSYVYAVTAVASGARLVIHPAHGNVPLAVLAALLSTTCYATSAVLQQRESSRAGVSTGLVRQLIRRPWWWVAVVAAATAAGLHITALALGPLSLVQPIGVLTLVMALPLGARLGRRTVTRGEWQAAVAVALGLAAVLTVAPHHAPATRLSVLTVLCTVATVGAVVLCLVGLAARLPRRGAGVVRAAAAATCFGCASGMTRIAATGTAPFPLAALAAVLGAAVGLGLAQLAYRKGGLGAPLATQILVDPLVAVIIGVALLEEPVPVSPLRAAIGIGGLFATVTGIWALSRTTPLELAGAHAIEKAR
jgi:drug/metabolite transporter (DMT)-like permease